MKIKNSAALLAILAFIGCSKKDEPQIAAPTSEVKIFKQFTSNQSGAWGDSRLGTANVTTTTASDPQNSDRYQFTFVTTFTGGENSEIKIFLDKDYLNSGVLGVYTLGTDFNCSFSYQPAGCSSIYRIPTFGDGNSKFKTFTITTYNSGTKRVDGNFEVTADGLNNPRDCPSTANSSLGELRVKGTFTNLPVPF